MEVEDTQIRKKQLQNWCNRRLSTTFAIGTQKNETSATEWRTLIVLLQKNEIIWLTTIEDKA